MRILFVNLLPFPPQLVGGVETSTVQLGKRLEASGHEVAVLCTLRREGAVGFLNALTRRLTGRGFPSDRFSGLRAYRGYDVRQGLRDVLAEFPADVLVVSGGTDGTLELAAACAESGRPTFHYFHDVASIRRLETPPALGGLHFIANSRYTAAVARDLLGVSALVLPPLVEPDLYRTADGKRTAVTVVNLREIKGGDIALALARSCPDIPFVFVEAWTTDDPFVASIRDAAARLPNVSWTRPISDMRRIYAATRVLLVPSRWEETWGRVVTEAHVSGIPVLSSSTGALPESVGNGGLLLDPGTPMDRWTESLRTMWDDPATYGRLADNARRCAARPEIQPDGIVARLCAYLAERTPAESRFDLPDDAPSHLERR